MAAKKQYGLIIPNKSKQTIQKPSLFDDNSDEEPLDPRQKIDTWKSKVKKRTHLEIQKILEEDPTVYEYDSIYDDMQKQKAVKKEIVTKDRKPKYINSLMKAAEVRKKEYERRIERQIQKEREKEGEEFEDKEAFVTSSYKKKLLERQEEEERERRQKELEERMDVTKQKDLSGFYRHFLKQTTGEERIPTIEEKDGKAGSANEHSGRNAENEDDKQSAELQRAIELCKRDSSKKRDTDDSESDSSSENSDREDGHRKRKRDDRRCGSDGGRRHRRHGGDSKRRRQRSDSSEDDGRRRKERRRADEKRKSGGRQDRKHKSDHRRKEHRRRHCSSDLESGSK